MEITLFNNIYSLSDNTMMSVKMHNKNGDELSVIKVVDKIKEFLTHSNTNELLSNELVPLSSVSIGSVVPDPVLMFNFMLGYLVRKIVEENFLTVSVTYPKVIDTEGLKELDDKSFDELIQQIETMKEGARLVKNMLKEGFKHEKGDEKNGKKKKK